jgi:hypothetical protein
VGDAGGAINYTPAAGVVPATINCTPIASATNQVDLSATDLTSTGNAQAALTGLNRAITAVAAQDGYLARRSTP